MTLKAMNDGLRYNVFELKDPFVFNSDRDRKDLLEKVPEHVFYSCKYWFEHFESIADNELGILFNNFVQDHFYHWLEVLSVSDEISSAIVGLRRVSSNTVSIKS